MAFPGNGTRYVIGGTLPGGERFSTGVYAPVFDESVSMQSVADGAVQAGSLFQAFIAQARTLMHSGCAYSTLTVYRYGSGRAATDVGTANIGPVAGNNSIIHPNQTALCVTLRTSLANRRGRGRMYLPATAGQIGTNGLRTAGDIQNVLTPLGAWLDQINAEVWSETATSKLRVNRIDADLVSDTINQRRDRLTSSRVVVAIAQPD